MSSEDLIFELRRSGSPYVWPALMRLTTPGPSPELARARVAEWASAFNGEGGFRCGVAVLEVDGETRTVGIITTPLAELAGLPTRVHAGRWLVVRGALHPGVKDARVIVMGPTGRPQSLTTASAGGRFRAAFAAGEPGRWVVQVVATAESGPRPVLEAWVYAGVAPEASHAAHLAPGEEARGTLGEAGDAESVASSDADSIRRMTQAARASEGVGRLRRNARLDALALEHAETMRAAGIAGHDAGRGNTTERFAAAGVAFEVMGENIARASSPEAAHRALWASPTHRANTLNADFREFGVATVRSPDGTLWVCQLFATLPR